MEGEKSANKGIVGNIILHPHGTVVDLTGQIHQLPCCIKHDGPSSVSDYFKPKDIGVEVDGLCVEEAFFRGRKLQGTTIPVPEGYRGFVLGKKGNGKGIASEMSEERWNSWETRANFQSMSCWNHDSLPSRDDSSMRCFHWFAVADALHRPLKAEDLASASTLLEKR